MGRPGRKRLAVDIPIKIHEQIIEASYRQRIRMNTFVIRALIEKIYKDFGEKELTKSLKIIYEYDIK